MLLMNHINLCQFPLVFYSLLVDFTSVIIDTSFQQMLTYIMPHLQWTSFNLQNIIGPIQSKLVFVGKQWPLQAFAPSSHTKTTGVGSYSFAEIPRN